MADEAALEKLTEGVEAWNVWRGEQPELSGVDLSDANLRKIDLREADLSNANLICADLNGAQLDFADLSGANLEMANLSHAVLFGADFTGANLSAANLTGADAHEAVFTEATLFRTNLTDAILLNVEGLEVDTTRILHAHFPPYANDKWSILRRTYTGPNLVLNLLFMMLFFAPLVVKGAGLAALGDAQQRVVESVNRVDGHKLSVSCDGTNGAISGMVRGVEVRLPCRTEPMWRLLLGFGGPYGALMPILTGMLIGYQIARYLLTRQISLMRDAEERSGVSPPKEVSEHWVSPGIWPRRAFEFVRRQRRFITYPYLFRVHQILRVIFWIAAVTFALRAIEFLLLTEVIVVGAGP